MKNLNQDQERVKIKNRDTFESVNVLYEGRELILNSFINGTFPIKEP